MSRSLRVAIADPEAELRLFCEKAVTSLGHQVVISCASGRQLLDSCCVAAPEVVVAEVDLDDMDGIEVSLQLAKLSPTAFVLVTRRHDEETVRKATGDHVMNYLVKPIEAHDLAVSLPLARARFEQWKALHQEYYDAHTAIRDRRLIDQAKHILMKRLTVDEEEAFRKLRQMSFDKNLKMAVIAEMLVTAQQAFEGE